MKNITILTMMMIFLTACSRPTSPPVTPAQPPTVEETNSVAPGPTAPGEVH